MASYCEQLTHKTASWRWSPSYKSDS